MNMPAADPAGVVEPEPVVEPDEQPAWGYGRAVLRRPEARNSDLELSHVITTQEESRQLEATVIASVTRRSNLSDEQMAAERAELAELATRLGIDMDGL